MIAAIVKEPGVVEMTDVPDLGSPLHQGALARPYLQEVNRPARWLSKPRQEQFLALYEFVTDCGLSMPELAIHFVLSSDSVSTVLTGARSVEELERNVAAAEEGAVVGGDSERAQSDR